MANSIKKPVILVVDDEPPIRDIFQDFLGAEGYEVIVAADGKEALERLESHNVDLLITDLEMPNMNGIELLRAVQDRHHQLNTVMMTSFATVDSAIEAMKLGAFDYILKPFRITEVGIVIQRALEHLKLKNENIQLRQSVQLYELTKKFDVSLEVHEIFATIAKILTEEVGAELVAIRLRDPEHRNRFERLGVFPENFPFLDEIHAAFNPFQALKKHRADEPILENADGLSEYFSRTHFDRNIESFMSVPLKSEGEIVGFINAYSFDRQRRFTEGQRRFLYLMADRAAGAIDKSIMHNDLKKMFSDTIEGLASALEAKDNYTRGHSERVGEYARTIALGFGLPEKEAELLYHAGMLHDIGKIGMKLDMINKPGPLDKSELNVFRDHPTLSRDILKPIKFLEPIIGMVYYHHERWDGDGYPEKLAETNIPFGARVVCVADSYDVMTSDRPYRRRMSVQKAVDELVRCAGTQFDPAVVDVFIQELRKSHEFEIPKAEG